MPIKKQGTPRQPGPVIQDYSLIYYNILLNTLEMQRVFLDT